MKRAQPKQFEFQILKLTRQRRFAFLILLSLAFAVICSSGRAMAASSLKIGVHIESSEGKSTWETEAFESAIRIFLSNMNGVVVADEGTPAAIMITGRLSGATLSLESAGSGKAGKTSSAHIALKKNVSMEKFRHQVFGLVKPFTAPGMVSPESKPVDAVLSWILGVLVAGLICVAVRRAVKKSQKVWALTIAASQFGDKIHRRALFWVAAILISVFGGILLVRDSMIYHKVYVQRMEQERSNAK